MAINNPSAVAIRASEIPVIMIVGPPLVFWARLWKALIMPNTVPKSPINGALFPKVPRIEMRLSAMVFFRDGYGRAVFKSSPHAPGVLMVSNIFC